MNKTDFEKIFQKGFNKEKIYYEDAKKGESELRCFKCNAQAGFGYVYIKINGKYRKRARVKCVKRKSHAETLIKYTAKWVEAEHDLLMCKLNGNCNAPIQTDY
jgi:hypothetical protein